MEQQFLETGEVVGTHGIQGEIKILPWADSPEFLLQFQTLYLNGTPYAVRSSRVHKTCVLAKLDGVDTPEQAVLLRGQVVTVDRTGVKPPDGAVFIADLIGCRVFDEQEREIGRITDVLTLPASDVYVIEGEKKYMIPAVKEFIQERNVDEGYVRVRLIEGMAVE